MVGCYFGSFWKCNMLFRTALTREIYRSPNSICKHVMCELPCRVLIWDWDRFQSLSESEHCTLNWKSQCKKGLPCRSCDFSPPWFEQMSALITSSQPSIECRFLPLSCLSFLSLCLEFSYALTLELHISCYTFDQLLLVIVVQSLILWHKMSCAATKTHKSGPFSTEPYTVIYR